MHALAVSTQLATNKFLIQWFYSVGHLLFSTSLRKEGVAPNTWY